ncbi:MAG: nitroreductase [Pseudomonadota bacterium]
MNEQNPPLGAPLPACHESAEAQELMRLRRSTPADFMTAPGPDDETLDALLKIAARAPDHRRVTPFRFVTFSGDARARFGAVLRKRFAENEPGAEETRLDCEEARFMRAPVVVAVISSVDKASRTPEWEQILTVGAVCQNLLIASSAYGFAAQWLTEWYAFDDGVAAALGLGADERVAGFIYIGTAREEPKERARPDMSKIVSRYS